MLEVVARFRVDVAARFGEAALDGEMTGLLNRFEAAARSLLRQDYAGSGGDKAEKQADL